MTERNYDAYLKGMHKSLREKLFFLDRIDLGGYDSAIDFGCGGGEVLEALADSKAFSRVIGVDSDPYMREVASKRVPEAEVVPALDPSDVGERTLVVFSSVLHEVGDKWAEIRGAIEGTGCTVAARDMRFGGDPREPIPREDLSRLIRFSNPRLLADFAGKYGLSTCRDMCHYLLKYSYVDNWELELEEDYFSFDFAGLEALGKTEFVRDYVLGYKADRAMRDFGIRLRCPTHRQMIVRVALTKSK